MIHDSVESMFYSGKAGPYHHLSTVMLDGLTFQYSELPQLVDHLHSWSKYKELQRKTALPWDGKFGKELLTWL